MVTTLTKGIKFRSLIDQLTKQEFLRFVGQIFDENEGRTIKTSLFNHLLATSATDDLHNMNCNISKIIQSRKADTKSVKTSNTNLNELPLSIIGYTASFLKQVEYFSFATSNRSIFVGCNNPNMLMELSLINVADYSVINLSAFHSLRSLYINITNFKDFKLPTNNHQIMSNLEELLLDADKKKDFDFGSFLHENCINTLNITKLTLQCFGETHNIFRDVDGLKRLLAKYPNVQELALCALMVPYHALPAEELQELFPNLTKMVLSGGNKIRNALCVQVFGNNLETLILRNSPNSNNVYNVRNNNFAPLKKLMLMSPSKVLIDEILQTAHNLQEFVLQPFGNEVVSPSKNEMKAIFNNVFQCIFLQYLQIEINNKNWIQILDAIEAGLYKTNKTKREQLKIRVNARRSCFDSFNNLMVKIYVIIRRLISSQIKQFMFVLDLIKMEEPILYKKQYQEILNKLNNISPNINVLSEVDCDRSTIFVITNKNCKINGRTNFWMKIN